ncbi:MAG: signal peptidase I [Kiloniellales bacterium]|nr:signal peptidase I [Kiloniellales bacterium]
MIEHDEPRSPQADSETTSHEAAEAAKEGGKARAGGAFAEYRETLQTIVIAVLIALGIRTFAFEPFNIPSGSMIPTLLIGDYLFVSKFSYGYTRYSFPFSPPLFEGRLLGSLPERGDVAVFRKPGEEETDYIKRIVGLPGDRIQMIRGVLHINGEPVEREKLPAREGVGAYTEYVETLPNGRRHLIRERSDNEVTDNTSEYLVPEGHVFAMGDNRDNSQDSRSLFEVGYVPVENLIGRAEILFFSHNGTARFWEVWRWPWAVRFGRIFDGIE